MVNFRTGIPFLLFSILTVSCDPDGFPNNDDLAGTWVEQPPYSDTLVFRSNGSLIRTRQGVTDTIIFRTDGERGEVSFVNPSDPSEGEASYKVFFVSDNQMLLEDYRTTPTTQEDGNFKRR